MFSQYLYRFTYPMDFKNSGSVILCISYLCSRLFYDYNSFENTCWERLLLLQSPRSLNNKKVYNIWKTVLNKWYLEKHSETIRKKKVCKGSQAKDHVEKYANITWHMQIHLCILLNRKMHLHTNFTVRAVIWFWVLALHRNHLEPSGAVRNEW